MEASIVIVGLGALGSHVALFMRNIKELKLVDFDKVDSHNIQSQFHTKLSLGRNKAQSISQALLGMFNVKAEAVPHKLTKDNVRALLQDPSPPGKRKEPWLVLDCTDNIEARNLIQEYCLQWHLPCLHGALSADGSFSRVIWTEDFKADAEGDEGEATCIDGEHLPFFGMAAAVMAVEAQNFLVTGKKRSYQLTPSGMTRLA